MGFSERNRVQKHEKVEEWETEILLGAEILLLQKHHDTLKTGEQNDTGKAKK